MTDRLELSSYRFDGRDELCLKAGEKYAKRVLLIPPLFDELNRMRRMLVDVMRLLDRSDIASFLPDMPGTNESLYPQAEANLDIWRKALAACAKQHDCGTYVASFRGSSLIDDLKADTRIWRLAPAKGPGLLRAMMRTRIASDKEAGITTKMADLSNEVQTSAVNLAGNLIGSQMFRDLEQARPSDHKHCRTARLKSDSQSADAKIPGSPLWLRAEPDSDLVLSQAISDDITGWINK